MVQKGMRGNVGAVEYREEVREDTADSRSPSPPKDATTVHNDAPKYEDRFDSILMYKMSLYSGIEWYRRPVVLDSRLLLALVKRMGIAVSQQSVERMGIAVTQ